MNQLSDRGIKRFSATSKVFDPLSRWSDQYFIEIPTDISIFHPVDLLRSKPLVNGMLIFTFDVNFFGYWKTDSIIFWAKIGYFLRWTWLLTKELIARKTDHDQFFTILFVQFFQICVLRSVSAFGGYIDTKNIFSLIRFEIYGFSIQWINF